MADRQRSTRRSRKRLPTAEKSVRTTAHLPWIRRAAVAMMARFRTGPAGPCPDRGPANPIRSGSPHRMVAVTTTGRLPKRPGREWGRSSVGRALRSQCRGRGFDSLRLHLRRNPGTTTALAGVFSCLRRRAPIALVLSTDTVWVRRISRGSRSRAFGDRDPFQVRVPFHSGRVRDMFLMKQHRANTQSGARLPSAGRGRAVCWTLAAAAGG